MKIGGEVGKTTANDCFYYSDLITGTRMLYRRVVFSAKDVLSLSLSLVLTVKLWVIYLLTMK